MVRFDTPNTIYTLEGDDTDVEGSYNTEDRINDDEAAMRADYQEQALWQPNPNYYASPPSPPSGRDSYSLRPYSPPPPARWYPQQTPAPPSTNNYYPAPAPYNPAPVPAPAYGGRCYCPQHPMTYNDSRQMEDRSRFTNRDNSYLSSDNRDNHHSNNITINIYNPQIEINAHKPRNALNVKWWKNGKKVGPGNGGRGGGVGGNLIAPAVQGAVGGAVQGGFAAAGLP